MTSRSRCYLLSVIVYPRCIYVPTFSTFWPGIVISFWLFWLLVMYLVSFRFISKPTIFAFLCKLVNICFSSSLVWAKIVMSSANLNYVNRSPCMLNSFCLSLHFLMNILHDHDKQLGRYDIALSKVSVNLNFIRNVIVALQWVFCIRSMYRWPIFAFRIAAVTAQNCTVSNAFLKSINSVHSARSYSFVFFYLLNSMHYTLFF